MLMPLASLRKLCLGFMEVNHQSFAIYVKTIGTQWTKTHPHEKRADSLYGGIS